MANFSTGSTYNYFSDSNKLKGILYAGNNISLLSNDAGYALSTGTVATASYALTASYFSGSIANAISASYATTSSYILNAVSASRAATSSFVTTLNQNVIITGALAIGTGSLGNGENNLILGPAPAGGSGEGGQLALLAKGDSYTSSSLLDTWQDQFRILRGPGATSNAGLMYMNLHSGNTQFVGAVTASNFSGLPNDYLYVTRNTTQTTGTNWASQTIIFNNVIASRGITYDTGTGVISLTGGKVYRITSRVAWSALGSYTFEISCYDSASNQLGPIAQQLAPGNGSFNSSDGTLDFIYAPASNIGVQIKTTSNTTALSGESVRGDLNTQLIIQQIA
jgi:hypothetical protein